MDKLDPSVQCPDKNNTVHPFNCESFCRYAIENLLYKEIYIYFCFTDKLLMVALLGVLAVTMRQLFLYVKVHKVEWRKDVRFVILVLCAASNFLGLIDYGFFKINQRRVLAIVFDLI